MIQQVELLPPDADDGVEEEIFRCLTPGKPQSFFLYAGAGSGKTRSLKQALEKFRDKHGDEFRSYGKKIAVITYTNAAADEIARRVGEDALFPVSTIHSFCWAHIGLYHTDIQSWLLKHLPEDRAELALKQAKGKSASKATQDRARAMVEIDQRLKWLEEPRRFVYNPNGDNFGADSLSHSEVLRITASFVAEKPSMQEVLVNRYPFLLIDESQDTNSALMDALFILAASKTDRFGLGLFGDTMQRIFPDGLPNLGQVLPEGWARPVKRLNHRSPRRVIKLANEIRKPVDQQVQAARDDSSEGIVRLFVASAGNGVEGIERQACQRMAALTGDQLWLSPRASVKTLTLEHHMAAARGGFLPMFQAIDADSRLQAGLRKGELAGLRLFTERVAPLVAASRVGDQFAVMELMRNTSPLLKPETLSATEKNGDPLRPAREAASSIVELVNGNPSVRFLDVLHVVAKSGVFEIPGALRPFVFQEEVEITTAQTEEDESSEENDEAEPTSSSLAAWRTFLETPYVQIDAYAAHVRDLGPFGTHQGVKGLEFDRVMVILDDTSARGFLFSYEKLLTTTPGAPSKAMIGTTGADSTVDKTRRLLYVTCTRAQKSLALVLYASDPSSLAKSVLAQGWFAAEEIEQLN